MNTITLSHPYERLTTCIDCNSKMSWTADRCVRCGGENGQSHPLIESILSHVKKRKNVPGFEYTATHNSIRGTADRGLQYIWKGSLAITLTSGLFYWDTNIAMSLVGIGSLGIMLAAFLSYVVNYVKTFEVRVAGDKVFWTSDDDKYWHNVKWIVEHPW